MLKIQKLTRLDKIDTSRQPTNSKKKTVLTLEIIGLFFLHLLLIYFTDDRLLDMEEWSRPILRRSVV